MNVDLSLQEPLQIAEDLEDGEKKDVDADPSSQKARKNSTENVVCLSPFLLPI